ncbi:unnamed protein product (macronuclear) [Paramecium tetraurelia]|uniref:Uncharacterized protein n=1 Tax=Paramecium tetraurelia TaxID=5888 RepID=A0BL91_PARTE|nr:uncharacterized protein GSPATT00029940001 [Paramecium tetraurelia]CAK59308.1 unnamed protein product [Paramecium tetraurelia]|eukprot:XP_001426706.1 hypothetical protein (macronuclear) [Paramecium tetraurelia strain d4-2]
MYNQIIEQKAIESLLNICYDDQPQYDDDYECEIKKILQRTITERLKKQKTEMSTRLNTISFRTTSKTPTQFRFKTETRSLTKPVRLPARVKNFQLITQKPPGKPTAKSLRNFNQKNQVPLKASIVSLQNSSGFSILNQSEYQHPVLVIQKKSQYIPRFVLKLQKSQLLNSK